MDDILFDIVNREIVISGAGSNSDFELTTNPSVQNGGSLMYSRGANIALPIFGIGVEDFINGNMTNAAKELARWQQQVIQDGGRGSYKSNPNTNEIDFILDVNYLQ